MKCVLDAARTRTNGRRASSAACATEMTLGTLIELVCLHTLTYNQQQTSIYLLGAAVKVKALVLLLQPSAIVYSYGK